MSDTSESPLTPTEEARFLTPVSAPANLYLGCGPAHQAQLQEIGETITRLSPDAYDLFREIIHDLANVRANSIRDDLIEKVSARVEEVLTEEHGSTLSDEASTAIEDTVYTEVHEAFLERFGDA